MRSSRALKVVLTVTTGVAVAATAAGVTYAATTTTTKVVYACANRAGTLKLLSKGKCPLHYGKVAINKQGQRGLTGPRGPQGPGAFTISVPTHGTTAPATERRISVAGIAVSIFCGQGPSAEMDLDGDPSTVGYTVAGQSQFGGGTASILHRLTNDTGAQTDPVPTGASLVSLDEPATGNSTEFFNHGGDWYADLIVSRGSHAFAVQMHSVAGPGRCLVRAVVTPAG